MQFLHYSYFTALLIAAATASPLHPVLRAEGLEARTNKGHSTGTSISGNPKDASDTEVDCSIGACNTGCYAALCLDSSRPTGVKLDGVSGFRTSPMVRGGDMEANRKASGALRSVSTFEKAGLQSSGPSGDEWPLAASQSGGAGAIVQFIDKDANIGVGRLFTKNVSGYVVFTNFQQADVCHDIETLTVADAKEKICGKDKRFGVFTGQPNKPATWKIAD